MPHRRSALCSRCCAREGGDPEPSPSESREKESGKKGRGCGPADAVRQYLDTLFTLPPEVVVRAHVSEEGSRLAGSSQEVASVLQLVWALREARKFCALPQFSWASSEAQPSAPPQRSAAL